MALCLNGWLMFQVTDFTTVWIHSNLTLQYPLLPNFLNSLSIPWFRSYSAMVTALHLVAITSILDFPLIVPIASSDYQSSWTNSTYAAVISVSTPSLPIIHVLHANWPVLTLPSSYCPIDPCKLLCSNSFSCHITTICLDNLICHVLSIYPSCHVLSIYLTCPVLSIYLICHVISIYPICPVLSIYPICHVLSIYLICHVLSIYLICHVLSIHPICSVLSIYPICPGQTLTLSFPKLPLPICSGFTLPTIVHVVLLMYVISFSSFMYSIYLLPSSTPSTFSQYS